MYRTDGRGGPLHAGELEREPVKTETAKCIHFKGIQNICRAGVNPMTVRDTGKPGIAVWPCLSRAGSRACDTTCDKQRIMTPEEREAEDAEIDAAVAVFMKDLAEGRCPSCRAVVEKREQVGRCQYARPCGHRLGQVGGEEEGP